MTPNWWSWKFWYFWGPGNRITDLIQTCRLYRFCQHYCPLTNITRPCIRIVYFIYITYLVKLYLVLSVLQFPDDANFNWLWSWPNFLFWNFEVTSLHFVVTLCEVWIWLKEVNLKCGKNKTLIGQRGDRTQDLRVTTVVLARRSNQLS